MSNVIQHPSSRRYAEQRLAERAKRQATLEKEGGVALKNLIGWLGYIPEDRRIRMAQNMENIFLCYDIKIAELDWRREYDSIENFRLNVHRMRLPANGHDGRRLVASRYKWGGMLKLIHDCVQKKGEGVSLEFLADQLTRGTDFHPAKKSNSKSEKLLYLLNGWANEIDAEHGIMSIYRKIAAARVEYLRLNLKGMDEIEDWFYQEKPKCAHHTVADDPGLSIQEPANICRTKLEYLNAEDWDRIAAVLPNDNWRAVYREAKQEIDAWKQQFVESTTLVFEEFAEQCVVLGNSLAFLPHWFVGFDAQEDSTENVPWMSDRVSNHGTDDPLQYCDEVDGEWDCYYLVLYPNQTMTRLIPYLFMFYEGTRCSPLGEVDMDISIFKPEPKGVHSISRSLSDRIQESLEELRDSWKSTASRLENHPYLKWKQERDSAIDDQIKAMLDRTGKGKKRR